MTYNILIKMTTYGKRTKINLRVTGLILIFICLVTPFTNFFILPLSKLKGNMYI